MHALNNAVFLSHPDMKSKDEVGVCVCVWLDSVIVEP